MLKLRPKEEEEKKIVKGGLKGEKNVKMQRYKSKYEDAGYFTQQYISDIFLCNFNVTC